MSLSKNVIHDTSIIVDAIDLYFASAMDRAIVLYFFKLQEMQYPIVLRLTREQPAQSKSEKLYKFSEL